MIQEIFGALLEELGSVMNMRLSPDRNNSCLFTYQNGLKVQLEHDTGNNQIIAVAYIGTPPPGRYRENLFKEALKANGLPLPQPGAFAYSKKTDSLVLYGYISITELTGQKLADFLAPFIQRADLWRNAMGRGEIPSFTGTELSFGRSGGGIFGLH